jgi:hypothetical protein
MAAARGYCSALGAGIGVTLAKVGAAVFTGPSAMAAEASHSLADNANGLSLFIAQRRSSRPAFLLGGGDVAADRTATPTLDLRLSRRPRPQG